MSTVALVQSWSMASTPSRPESTVATFPCVIPDASRRRRLPGVLPLGFHVCQGALTGECDRGRTMPCPKIHCQRGGALYS